MLLSNYTKDGILTVVFTDARILDDAKIEKVGSDLVEMLNKSAEERVILAAQIAGEGRCSCYAGLLIVGPAFQQGVDKLAACCVSVLCVLGKPAGDDVSVGDWQSAEVGLVIQVLQRQLRLVCAGSVPVSIP